MDFAYWRGGLVFARLSACFLALLALLGCGKPSARLIVLAVGQGDCSAISSGGVTALIDVGPKDLKFDAGDRIVLPGLRRHRLDSVEMVFISHPDKDHIGGLGAVHKRFPGAKIFASSAFRGQEAMTAGLKEAGVTESQVDWIDSGTNVSCGDLRFEILCPPLYDPKADNDASMIMRVQIGTSSAVFSGDAPMSTEAWALKRVSWTADVLKVGHHGSKTATSPEWLAAIKPREAVISCGRGNPFGHPHRQVTSQLDGAKVRTWRTDQQGDIVFEATAQGFQPVR